MATTRAARCRSSAGSTGSTRQSTLRFLRHFGMHDPAFLAAHLDVDPPPPRRAIGTTGGVTIESELFAVAMPVAGLHTVPRRGTLRAGDGEREELTRATSAC